MNPWKLWTARLLILSGAFLTLAIVPVFFPVSIMERLHSWLGLGEFPVYPITIYLARSTSLLYFVHGITTIFVGWHIQRLWPMVRLLGALHLTIGLMMIYIDINAEMPLYWTSGEGAPVAGLGILILYLSACGEKPFEGA